MDPRRFALIGGIVMLVFGVFALIAPGSVDGLPALNQETSYGLFLGLFPMNVINKAALIIFGIAGIAAANAKFTSLPMSIHWSRAVLFVMGLLAIMGLIPQTNTLFGYAPLFRGEIVTHAIFALLGGYFGYALTSKVPDQTPRGTEYRTPMQSSR